MQKKVVTRIGHNISWRKTVGSTNDELKCLAQTGAEHGTVLIADHQTKGRGRMGRIWDSPAGDNVYMSVLLMPQIEPMKASMLTLVAALAVAEAIEECLREMVKQDDTTEQFLDKEETCKEEESCDEEGKNLLQIKWPNDLVLNGRKVCGILTEMSAGTEGIRYVIVGIGINVNREAFPEEIAHMATAIRLPSCAEGCRVQDVCLSSSSQCHGSVSEAGDAQDKSGRDWLVAKILHHFEEKYEQFLETGDLKPFLQEYNNKLSGLNQEVQILSREGNRIGISRGIDETGALLVENPDGEIEKIISGEVSVRGLYGYVD